MAGGASGAFGGAMAGAGVGAAFGGPVGAGIGAGVGGIVGLGTSFFGDKDAEKRLLQQQRRMAEDAARRERIMQQARTQANSQSVLAFSPHNKVMAQMFGPEAAFSGQQMGDMTANPMGAPKPPEGEIANLAKAWEGMSDQEIRDQFKGTNPSAAGGKRNTDRVSAVLDYRRQVAEYERMERERRAKLEQNFAPSAGPAPIAPTQAAPARRF
jgi:hypothetical protein